MRGWLTFLRHQAILWKRIMVFSSGEFFYLGGNLVPRRVGVYLWQMALCLNPHHIGAAVNRALALVDGRGDRGWEALQFLLKCVENQGGASASDLFLTWIPGRLIRCFAARLLWGISGQDQLRRTHDRVVLTACATLAAIHFRRALGDGNFSRASEALKAWSSLAGETLEVRWSEIEMAWASGAMEESARMACPLVEKGSFLSPLDTLYWAERFADAGKRGLAWQCLKWARSWVPEEGSLWKLSGDLAWQEGKSDEARHHWERSLSLNPEDTGVFLRKLQSERGWDRLPPLDNAAKLFIQAPEEMPVGGRSQVSCRMESSREGWILFVLPPAGWGILPEALEVPFDLHGKTGVILNARRPDRVRGGPWPVTFVAVCPEGYVMDRREIRVPDPGPGRLLVTVTEDHEIHEERGSLSPDLLRKLLVEKSRFASSLGIRWTHMVEVGSALAMPARAARTGENAWGELHEDIRAHLIQDVAQGHDIQPHLHAFNDPDSVHFPYSVDQAGWHSSLRFLLTSPEFREDWASACPPPGQDGASGFDRLESVERAVAQVEALGRQGDPNYRAVLWRSGLLDYGKTTADCVWSAVAIRRAGLWADSDMPKPRSFLSTVKPAFLADWENPFRQKPGGPLVQVPISANLEGDYRMNLWQLQHRVCRIAADLRDEDGQWKPGVHLLTLSTHDKLVNARRGQEEFRLEEDYGDWITARQHLEAWRKEGATCITAREGVRAVLDDLTWHPIPWLDDETFITRPEGEQEVRYRLTLLGGDSDLSAGFGQHVLVTVPPSLRPLITSIRVQQGKESVPIEVERDQNAFWIMLAGDEYPIFCVFRLREPVGPVLRRIKSDSGGLWKMILECPTPFIQARILLPEGIPLSLKGAWTAYDEEGNLLPCEPDPWGLVLGPLHLQKNQSGNGHSLSLTLENTPNQEPESTRCEKWAGEVL